MLLGTRGADLLWLQQALDSNSHFNDVSFRGSYHGQKSKIVGVMFNAALGYLWRNLEAGTSGGLKPRMEPRYTVEARKLQYDHPLILKQN